MSQAARVATVDELNLLRAPGDWSRAYLAIYKPNVIYTAVLDGVPTSTDMVGEIPFVDGVGTLENVRAEMTLWVGSSAGARDLGVCRIRKAAIAGTIYIGFTSEIDWAEAATVYLTVLDHAMLWRKPVLMDAGVVLMDGEHAFVDQHIDFDPVPVLSCHAVGTLVGGEVAFQWDASNSWVFDSTIASYLWEAPGALSIDDDTSATPIITYDSAGNHPVYCTVTADNGKSATGIQFAFHFDADNKPWAVEIQDPTADYDTGGWSCAVKMHEDADPTNVIEGALAILFAEDHFGSTTQSLGQLENRENIICWGYIADESIVWDAEISSVEFEIQGPQFWLKKIEVNPIVLTCANNTPDAWEVMPALTVDRALWHSLHWRSNATALLNITLTGDARFAPKLDSMSGSLWTQMHDIAWNKIFGRLGCDRYGRFFAVIDPQMVPVVERTWAMVMTVTKKDWKENIDISRITQRALSMLSLSSWMCDVTGNIATLYSLAMGHIGAQFGKPEVVDKLLSSSQAQSNEMAGLYMGWKNCEFEFDLTLAQNNRMIDLWPNQYLDIVVAAQDTPRGIAYAGNLIPRSMTLKLDADAGCWDTEITCEAETFPELAVDGDVPGIEDDLSFPPMPPFPPPPEIPPIEWPPVVINPNHPKVVVIASDKGVLYTTNFNEDDPTWQYMNNGLLAGIDTIDIFDLVVTPSGALYLLFEIGNKIMRAAGLGGTWYQVASPSDFESAIRITAMGVNPFEDDTIAVGAGGNYSDLDSGGALLGGFRLMVNGVMSGSETPINFQPRMSGLNFANGEWFFAGCVRNVFSTAWLYVLSSTGAGVFNRDLTTWVGQDAAERYFASIGSSGAMFQWDSSGAGGFNLISAHGSVVNRNTSLTPTVRQGLAASPVGLVAMASQGGVAYLTTDAGATWSSLGGVIPIGSDVWENCRDNNRFLFGGGYIVRLTTDLGMSYFNKSGNLFYLSPLIDVTHIRFIE